MTGQIRSRAATALLLALAAATITACGAQSSASSDTPDPASSRAVAKTIIAQALALNPKASSARLTGTLDLDIDGIRRLHGPIQATLDGSYNLADGATVPDVELDVSVSANDHVLGGSLVLVDGKAYIKLGNVGYEIPDAITKVLTAPAADANNGLTKVAAMFHIHPETWQRGARLTGESTVAGENVQELQAEIRPDVAFRDLARLVHFLSLLGIPQALGLPSELTPQLQAALVRSVTDARGAVWIGSSDHVLRKAHVEGKGVVAPRDRELLYGATGATLAADLSVFDVGVPQEISAPKQLAPYSSLQLTLSALAEYARREVRAAKRDAQAAAR